MIHLCAHKDYVVRAGGKMACKYLVKNKKGSEWGGRCVNVNTVSNQVPLTEESECWFRECCNGYRGKGKDG